MRKNSMMRFNTKRTGCILLLFFDPLPLLLPLPCNHAKGFQLLLLAEGGGGAGGGTSCWVLLGLLLCLLPVGLLLPCSLSSLPPLPGLLLWALPKPLLPLLLGPAALVLLLSLAALHIWLL
jgi:hypothetical protein